jgi:hypothetical protein
MNLTKHASKRTQQRGFKKGYLDLLIKYGKQTRKPGNVLEIKVTKKEIYRITQELCILKRQLSNIRNKAILIDPNTNTIITAYNRCK